MLHFPTSLAVLDAPNGLGVSRPPPTRSPTVKIDAQLRQLGGSAARRVGRTVTVSGA